MAWQTRWILEQDKWPIDTRADVAHTQTGWFDYECDKSSNDQDGRRTACDDRQSHKSIKDATIWGFELLEVPRRGTSVTHLRVLAL